MTLRTLDEKEIVAFPHIGDFETWLQKHHKHSPGLWVRFYKKGSNIKSVTYSEALDSALCYGWIDSQVKKYDEQSYIQRFSPRGKKSMWSVVNRKHIARLTREGRMQPAGIAAVTAAKKDGRWQKAYLPSSQAHIPLDLKKVIDKSPVLKAYVATLSRANIYYIFFQLTTAKKPETRARRLEKILLHLRAGKKWH
ncbi:MAG: hypothetical protein RI911_447 [Candidatus Parcubacteria bacterium]|jgi:uncharacterized protein YdeI (YjbR/CyaY-like superfamily)